MIRTMLDRHRRMLVERGYTLLDDVTGDSQADEELRCFGDILPQYDGSLRYQVKAGEGFEIRHYSKSANTVLAHTEAPGWDPPPRLLALHCKTQAQCGLGHTQLADALTFVASLAGHERSALHEREIFWPGRNLEGGIAQGVRKPVLERTADNGDIVRFSYNLLTAGCYEPLVHQQVSFDRLPLGALGVKLAERATAFFQAAGISILIPDRSVLVWDNQRMMHARTAYRDSRRHLTRYWLGEPI